MSGIIKGLSETKKDEKGFMPTPRQIPAPPGGHPVPPGYERVKSWGGAWELRKKKADKSTDEVTDEGYSAGVSGGAGLDEKINTPGGMGQSYRKFRPKAAGVAEEQAPMFTPEDKMINANDPSSNGWRVYKAAPSGIMEGIIQEYDTKTIDQVVERLPKGLTVNNFTIPAFKEYLYNKYYETERQNWKELRNIFAQEYRQKHGIKEYKLGDLNYFDDMLLALPKGLSPEQIYIQGYKEFIYQKHGDKEWPNFKKNRFTYWDAYEKAGGTKPQGMFSKLKSKIGLEEDVYTNSLYKEFLDSDYNKNQGSYIETLRNLGQFIRSKGMPEDKAKPIIRKLVAKLHPSGLNEEQMLVAELKCWQGYTRVRGVPAGAPGSCKKKTKESSIMKGIQNEYEVDSIRKIEFSKENPPNLDYLYQQFIHNMLSSENKVSPKDWINAVNNRYGLGYTWKDYQLKGHQDHTNNWDKIIKKYILGK